MGVVGVHSLNFQILESDCDLERMDEHAHWMESPLWTSPSLGSRKSNREVLHDWILHLECLPSRVRVLSWWSSYNSSLVLWRIVVLYLLLKAAIPAQTHQEERLENSFIVTLSYVSPVYFPRLDLPSTLFQREKWAISFAWYFVFCP